MKRPIINIMGQTFDKNRMSMAKLQDALQQRLDTIRPDRGWKIHVGNNSSDHDPGDNICYTFTFEREGEIPMYCYIRYEDEGFMLDSDADLLTGGNMSGLPLYDFLQRDSGHPSVKIMEFEEHFQELCKSAGASVPTYIELIQTYRGALQVIIEYPETY